MGCEPLGGDDVVPAAFADVVVFPGNSRNP